MAPKKKGTKGKKKKSEGEVKAVSEAPPVPEVIVEFKPQHFVTLHVKLVTWEYLNFSLTLPTNVRVFTVMERIREQHGGSILDVVLYREKVLPKNRISEPDKSLEDVGITGGPQGANAQCVVWYDYTPHQSQCPLLLSSPRDASGRKPLPRRSQMGSRESGAGGGVGAGGAGGGGGAHHSMDRSRLDRSTLASGGGAHNASSSTNAGAGAGAHQQQQTTTTAATAASAPAPAPAPAPATTAASPSSASPAAAVGGGPPPIIAEGSATTAAAEGGSDSPAAAGTPNVVVSQPEATTSSETEAAAPAAPPPQEAPTAGDE